jgi:hypothetical protein
MAVQLACPHEKRPLVFGLRCHPHSVTGHPVCY